MCSVIYPWKLVHAPVGTSFTLIPTGMTLVKLSRIQSKTVNKTNVPKVDEDLVVMLGVIKEGGRMSVTRIHCVYVCMSDNMSKKLAFTV